MNRIISFTGPNFFLSNFYPCEVAFEGRVYKSSEHAYMAAKTTDENIRAYIAAQSTPSAAKKVGRSIQLRENWNSIRIHYMQTILESKFGDYELRDKLNATKGYELIEGNTWGDVFWGVCNGKGQNNLGKLLMQIRDGITNFGV
jgi:N-glycosidase YbiA